MNGAAEDAAAAAAAHLLVRVRVPTSINDAHTHWHTAVRTQLTACEEELRGQRKMVHLLQDELATSDRELALKDEVIKHLHSLLEGEKQARAVEMQPNLSAEQLQQRLASSQIDLAHTTFVTWPFPVHPSFFFGGATRTLLPLLRLGCARQPTVARGNRVCAR